jgi:histidyl-tRNA synthetase
MPFILTRICCYSCSHALTCVQLEINSIGSLQDREAYRDTLKTYLDKHRSSLSFKSRTKLDRGSVLRVLDSNEAEDQEVISGAPLLLEHMSEDSLKRFEAVLQGLEWLGIERYVVNPHLVRGLDYYAHTAFEFKDYSLGAKTAVLAGGRYDSLIQQMGGPADTPAIGWACGIERISQLLDEQAVAKQMSGSKPIVVVAMRSKVFKHADDVKIERLAALAKRTAPSSFPASNAASDEGTEVTKFCMQLCQRLRMQGKFDNVQFLEKANFQKQLQHANKIEARCAIIVGPEEMKQNKVQVKDLVRRQQQTVSLGELEQHLKGLISEGPSKQE